jgi:hypothetical protein
VLGRKAQCLTAGKWEVREKRSRPGRNPHTGDRIEITARRVVTFHPSDMLRDIDIDSSCASAKPLGKHRKVLVSSSDA